MARIVQRTRMCQGWTLDAMASNSIAVFSIISACILFAYMTLPINICSTPWILLIVIITVVRHFEEKIFQRR